MLIKLYEYVIFYNWDKLNLYLEGYGNKNNEEENYDILLRYIYVRILIKYIFIYKPNLSKYIKSYFLLYNYILYVIIITYILIYIFII